MSNFSEEQRIDLLSKVSFFSEVSIASLQNLSKHLKEETFVKNQTIFKQGDIGKAMYAIIEGKVKVHEKDHIYAYLTSGDCFGEYALIDNDSRSASVTASERTVVIKIERAHFLELMTHDAGFAKGILADMIKRHRELDIIQEQLASSKQTIELASAKMKGLIEGAMDSIIMFDSRFKIVLTNPSACKMLQNEDVIGRNVLFFLDQESAQLIESLVEDQNENDNSALNNYLPNVIKAIGSDEKETLNEGTISKYGSSEDTFYTLILRDLEERLQAEDKISLLTKQTEYLEEELRELTSEHEIIAEDKSMKHVINLISQVSRTDATVLITGETGTGKELVARAIHKNSQRNDRPLIRINCGAIPHNLIESELFGHKKGAFTGATENRKGRFLLANKGTIFLDEIGEMPLDLQPKLLRVIQEGEFDPVGSSETMKVDVRIIAATHRDLFKHAQEGKFREDLYYRLNVFPIHIPPLRNRGQDVYSIANEMITQFASKFNKPIVKLSEADKVLLSSYSWPGNVRELQNLVERAVIVSKDGSINWQHIIPDAISNTESVQQEANQKILTSKELVQLEKENILKALKQTRWKISGENGAAALLQLPPTTLASRIKALGIERPV